MLYPLSYGSGELSLEAAGRGELRAGGVSPDRDGKSSWHFTAGCRTAGPMADSRIDVTFDLVVQEIEHDSLTSHDLAATHKASLATDPGERVCDLPAVWLKAAGRDDVRLGNPAVSARHQQLQDRELRRREVHPIASRPHLSAPSAETKGPGNEPPRRH